MKNRKKRKKIKIRHTWNLNPATKVHSVDTDYNRAKLKQSLKADIDKDLEEDEDDFIDFDEW